MSITNSIKRALYRNLSLDGYLRTMSRLFFTGYMLGLGRRSATYEYPRFLKHFVREGDTVLDIGANLGYYSRILSRLVGKDGKVYAVEPVKPILKVLEHNLRGCGNVEILPYALGSEDRDITMGNDSSRYTGYMGTGRNYVMGSAEENHPALTGTSPQEGNGDIIEFAAEMRRGSELFAGLRRLDFVKCDIEGYETTVIPEMAAVFEKFRPVVLLETGGPNRREMLKIFREWGYAGYVLQNGKLVSVMHAQEKDIVFVPGHRHAEFTELIAK